MMVALSLNMRYVMNGKTLDRSIPSLLNLKVYDSTTAPKRNYLVRSRVARLKTYRFYAAQKTFCSKNCSHRTFRFFKQHSRAMNYTKKFYKAYKKGKLAFVPLTIPIFSIIVLLKTKSTWKSKRFLLHPHISGLMKISSNEHETIKITP